MLKRIRIEVEGEESAASTEEALTRYEQALHATEADRFGIGGMTEEVLTWQSEVPVRSFTTGKPEWTRWEEPKNFADVALGREVTDEVIEFDPSLPGYRGRRVIKFARVDTRTEELSTGDHRASYP